MSGIERHADLAVGLEAPDPRPVSGARVDDHKGRFGIDGRSFRWHDPDESVVDGSLKSAAIDDKFGVIVENVRHLLRDMLLVPRFPRCRITSQKRAVRCAASTMYSAAAANGPKAVEGLPAIPAPAVSL